MSIVFVLIRTDIKKTPKVLTDLKNIPEVEETWLVNGTYDIIAKVKIGTDQPSTDPTYLKIRNLDGLRSTLIMKVID